MLQNNIFSFDRENDFSFCRRSVPKNYCRKDHALKWNSYVLISSRHFVYPCWYTTINKSTRGDCSRIASRNSEAWWYTTTNKATRGYCSRIASRNSEAGTTRRCSRVDEFQISQVQTFRACWSHETLRSRVRRQRRQTGPCRSPCHMPVFTHYALHTTQLDHG